ncbi:MAG: hypothetical protein ACRDHO_01405 [Actinomycetota bacterium]
MSWSELKVWARAHRGSAVAVLGLLWTIGTAGVGFGVVRMYYEGKCHEEKGLFAECSGAGDGAMWAVIIAVSVIALICGFIIFAADENS